jgi:23S rRNA (uridine2552-2'-O)-methyltransferase
MEDMVSKDRIWDFYAEKAKKEGYPARSVYKLEEFDLKHKILKKGSNVLDLGAAPGSWSLYASLKVGEKGKVLALDLNKLTVNRPNLKALEADIFLKDPEELDPLGPFDIVLSDLAPSTTGVKDADRENSLSLSRRALDYASRLLKPGGVFLFKLFQGESADSFVKESVKPFFQKTVLLKPKATRKGSVEIFVLGTGYRAGRDKKD